MEAGMRFHGCFSIKKVDKKLLKEKSGTEDKNKLTLFVYCKSNLKK
jgi:hypothetical protein